nr:Mariner Mos1 transposase [Hymenolepis microstoma]
MSLVLPIQGEHLLLLKDKLSGLPNAEHIRSTTLLPSFSKRWRLTEDHRIVSDTYDKTAISERKCQEWFQRFKSGVEDRHSGGREKVVVDAELEKIMGIARWSDCYVNTSADEYPWLKSHALSLVVRDQLGVIYYELLKPSQNNERHDKVVLQHGNARPPHVAKVVKKYIEALKWEILPHPPYSPDVAPSHFHLTHLAQRHTAWLTST